MAKYPKPEYYSMDSAQMRAFGVDFDNENVKKYYACLRKRWTKGGQKGMMPLANLLWLAAYPDVLAMQQARPEPEYNLPPEEPELVGAVDGSEHANDDVF